jgi:hypothetical protein
MRNYLFFIFFLIILVFSCKTIEKKVLTKATENIIEIKYNPGFSENIKINGKLLLNFDQIDPNLTYNDKSIFDSSSDASSDKISEKYIYDKNRLKELKEYEKYFSDNSEARLKDLFEKYDISLSGTRSDASDDSYRLDVKFVKYDTGEYNLIKNLNTKILSYIDLYSGSKNIFTIKKIYEIKADITHPTESMRLDGIMQEINKDIIEMFLKIIPKKKVNK